MRPEPLIDIPALGIHVAGEPLGDDQFCVRCGAVLATQRPHAPESIPFGHYPIGALVERGPHWQSGRLSGEATCAKANIMITLEYTTIDGALELKTFSALPAAQQWAREKMGTMFDVGPSYAVDGYGTGKIVVITGTTLNQLFNLPLERD